MTRTATKTLTAKIDADVISALRHLGGGNPRRCIQGHTQNWYTGAELARSMARLQERGLIFAHDAYGTLSIWNGRQGPRCQFWSTREQLASQYGYADTEFSK